MRGTERIEKWKQTAISICVAITFVANIFVASAVSRPVSAQAAILTASNLDELAEIVRREGMARNEDFEVIFGGSKKEKDSLFTDRIDFFYYTLVTKDDPSTSDDADYLVGNIDFSKVAMQEAVAGSNTIRFTFTYFESAEETKAVNKATARILMELGVEGKTNYEKTKLIHDYVCRLITFVDNTKNASSVYSAYTKGKGLCNSYALCMYKLLTEAGVPCKWIGGEAGTGRDADGHAWNLVQLGNQWYHLDATWDDGEDGILYDYFLKGSEDFDEADPEQVHRMDDEYYYTDYLKIYPIAKTAFQEGMDDANSPGTFPQMAGEAGYRFIDLVTGKYPASGSLSLKKGKKDDIQLYVTKDAMDAIDKISYKVTKGKDLVKVKNLGYYKDDGEYFADLEVKGLKKGTAKIKVAVTLVNGKTQNYIFTVKIK